MFACRERICAAVITCVLSACDVSGMSFVFHCLTVKMASICMCNNSTVMTVARPNLAGVTTMVPSNVRMWFSGRRCLLSGTIGNWEQTFKTYLCDGREFEHETALRFVQILLVIRGSGRQGQGGGSVDPQKFGAEVRNCMCCLCRAAVNVMAVTTDHLSNF